MQFVIALCLLATAFTSQTQCLCASFTRNRDQCPCLHTQEYNFNQFKSTIMTILKQLQKSQAANNTIESNKKILSYIAIAYLSTFEKAEYSCIKSPLQRTCTENFIETLQEVIEILSDSITDVKATWTIIIDDLTYFAK